MRRLTRILVVAVTLAVTAAWPSPSSARHNFSILEVTPRTVSPGDSVAVSGFSYTETAVIRFGAVDGPVLAELEPSRDAIISGEVVIPADAQPGHHLIYAVQEDPGGKPNRLPGRARVTVEGAGAQEVVQALSLEPRPADFEVSGAGSLPTTVVAAVLTAGLLGIATMAFLRSAGHVSPGRRP